MKTNFVALLVFCGALLHLSGLQAAEKNLLPPTNKMESWRLEQHEGGKGTMKIEDDSAVFTVTEVDGTDWHVQAVQTNLELTEGKEYQLTFQIKASGERSVTVAANIDEEDWHAIGLTESLSVGKEFMSCEYTFRAENVSPKKNRISFALGDSKGTVTIKNIALSAK
jgi:hypothetical protein